MKRTYMTVALAMVSAATLGGCAASQAGEVADLSGLQVAFSTPSSEIPIIASMAGYVEARLASEGVTVVVQDGMFDPAKQAQQLEAAADSGDIAAAWVFPIVPEALRPTFEKLRAQGIPIVAMASPEDFGYPGKQRGMVFSVGDYAEYGTAIGDEAASCAKRSGASQALLLTAPTNAGGAKLVTDSLTTAYAEGAPGAPVVATAGAADPVAARTAADELIRSNPEATVVIAATDETALAAIDAFEAAGRTPDCVIVGGGGDGALEAQRAGKITALIRWDYAAVSEQAGAHLVQAMKDPSWEAPVLVTPVVVTR